MGASYKHSAPTALHVLRVGRYALTLIPRRRDKNFRTINAPDQPMIDDEATAQPTPATI